MAQDEAPAQGAEPQSPAAADPEGAQATGPWPSLLIRGLQLAALWSIAVVWPVFDVLKNEPDFFVARGNTAGDIILYTLLVTRFTMNEKIATHMSIILMASISVLGYAYRHFIDAGLSPDQFRTWLCAYPVVLFMAPFGTYILQRINVEWMLRGIVVLNIGQLAYFNLNNPSTGKLVASVIFSAVLMALFSLTLSHISKRKRELASGPAEAA